MVIASAKRLMLVRQFCRNKNKIAEIRERQTSRTAIGSKKTDEVLADLRRSYQAMSFDELWEHASRYGISEEDFEEVTIERDALILAIIKARFMGNGVTVG